MLRNLCYTAFGLTLAVAWLPAGSVSAQEGVLSHFYGSGVHNYYERDYFNALADLSAAIDGGSQDPRVYYYRALANFRTGNSAAAQRDLEKGAKLESADVDQFYPVAKSLERVQGRERLTIERYRALARAQARQRQRQRDEARYEQRRRAEAQVLRQLPLGPPPAPLRRAVAAPAVPAAAAEPATPPAARPSAPPAAATPFDNPPPANPAATSPFDEKPAKEAAPETPAAKPPAAEPDADNPFGDPDAKMPADKPADEGSGEENPFGGT